MQVEQIQDIPYTTLEKLRKDTIEYYVKFIQDEDIRTDAEKKEDKG